MTNELIEKALNVIKVQDISNHEQQLYVTSEHQLMERIIFAKAEELVELLDWSDTDFWLEFPLWARLLVYRLLVLLRPQDSHLKRRIAIGLRSFGPDWDEYADELESE